MTDLTAPALRPANPRFSSGPCAKIPGYSLEMLGDAPLGRSHRAAVGKAKLKEAIDLNTRMTAELSIALANIWNMESAQLMGMGEAGVMDAATAAEEQKFIKVLGGE